MMNDRFIVFVVSAVVLALAMVGQALGAEEWTDWIESSESESFIIGLAFTWERKPIQIFTRKNKTGRKEEVHIWKIGGMTGAILVEHAPHGYFFINNFRSSSNFVRSIKNFNYLSDINLVVDKKTVERGVNPIGPFLYSVSDKNNSNQVCLVFGQGGLSKGAGNEFEIVGETADFAVSGFECRPNESITLSQLEQSMLEDLKSIKVRR